MNGTLYSVQCMRAVMSLMARSSPCTANLVSYPYHAREWPTIPMSLNSHSLSLFTLSFYYVLKSEQGSFSTYGETHLDSLCYFCS